MESQYLKRKMKTLNKSNFNISINMWQHKLRHPEKYHGNGRKRKGRPKEIDLTKEDYKERYEILKKIPDLP